MEHAIQLGLLKGLDAAGIDWLVVVPSSGLGEAYRAFDHRGRCVYATREEEAIALACGLTVGGARPAVLMQQSGVGNCLNAVFTLADPYGILFPVLVGVRPEDDENLIQRASARSTNRVLDALGGARVDWSGPDPVPAFLDLLARGSRWVAFEL